MKFECKIEGLNCPNCAKKLEGQLNKSKHLKNVSIDFLKGKISYEAENENALSEIVKITSQVEPDAKIISKKTNKNKINKKLIIDLTILFLATIIGVCVLVFKMSTPLFWTLYILSVLMLGYKTYYKALRLLLKGIINENILITLSVIGATCLGEYMEGLMVILLYTIGKLLEGIALNKSKKSIEAITKLTPEFATIIEGESEKKVEPSEVEIGSIIVVHPGERVPIDGIIIEGQTSLNLQSLTGESLPVEAKVDDEILSGSIVLDGVIKIRTTKLFSDSTASRIINLIENASEKKSKTETVISKVAKWYTLGVMVLAVSVFGIVLLATGDYNLAIYRGLIFLLVSCPCAFAISVPLTYFSGLGNASKHGILIKGSNYLDACAKLNIVAFDKTGTITTGEFEVVEIEVCDDKLSKEDIVFYASLGEQNSLHPLAKAILNVNTKKLVKVKDFKEIAGKGLEFKHNNSNYFIGRKNKELSLTCTEVYQDERLLGIIYFKDKIKSTSALGINALKQDNVKTIMLSGDNESIVSEVAGQVGVDEFKANLLPEEKYQFLLNQKQTEKNHIGFVGDGINDSPSLAVADVGFSMGINGSQLSIEASDIVIVDDDPSKISKAIKISKHTRKIVWQNILISAGIKVLFLTLGAVGVTGMLEAVIADVGVTLMAILNSLRALKINFKSNSKLSELTTK